MAISLVAHAPIPVGAPSTGIDTTGANLLVVSGNQFLSTPPTLTDSLNNTWKSMYTAYDSPANLGIIGFYCLNPTVGPNHTFTFTGGFCTAEVQAFSGAGDLDRTTATVSGSGAVFSPGSLTPTIDGALVVSGIMTSNNPTDSSVIVDSGLTITDQQPFNGGVSFGTTMAYLIQDTSATVTPSFSWTGDASEVNGAIAAFAPQPGPAVYSVPDCRDYGNFPNDSVDVNGTLTYTVPSVDSRAAGAPVDSRAAGAPEACGTYPQNSRSNPPFGE